MSVTHVVGSPSKLQAGKAEVAVASTAPLQAAHCSPGRLSLLCLPIEILWCIFDACGLGPQDENTMEEALFNVTCLARLLLLCRTVHSVICRRPSYWHRIIISHKCSLRSIQTTLSHAGPQTNFHLILLWTQSPSFYHHVRDFRILFDSLELWHRVTHLLIQHNSVWKWRDAPGIQACSLFTQTQQSRHIRHAIIECSLHAIDVLPSLRMCTLDSLTLALSPIRNGMPRYRNANLGYIVAPSLTRLEINMPIKSWEAHDLLSRCQSLEHLRWIAPDRHLDACVDEPVVIMPELESLHIRHCGLTVMIKAPKIKSIVWDVHAAYASSGAPLWEETEGLQQNLASVQALTACTCTFPRLDDVIGDSPRLETFALCPSDNPGQNTFKNLVAILEKAHESLRLITIPVSASVTSWNYNPEYLYHLIAPRRDLRVECYLMDSFKDDVTSRDFEYLQRRLPSQFVVVPGFSREDIYHQLGCKLCPNHPKLSSS